jgi:hypothetical protein
MNHHNISTIIDFLDIIHFVGFEVSTAVVMKSIIFWDRGVKLLASVDLYTCPLDYAK